MLKIASASFVFALTLSGAIAAQEKPAAPVDAPKPAPAAKPEFSDAEKAAIDVLSIMAQRDEALKQLGACMGELSPLQAQVRDGQLRARLDTLRQVIERGHPGFKWDLEKGTLVPVPANAAKKD